MEAVSFVADAWPARHAACAAQATAAAAAAAGGTVTAPTSGNGTAGAGSGRTSGACADWSSSGAGQGRCIALVDYAGPAATLAWLSRFSMEGKVLDQLVGLKPRVVSATGSGIFAGASGLNALSGMPADAVAASVLHWIWLL